MLGISGYSGYSSYNYDNRYSSLSGVTRSDAAQKAQAASTRTAARTAVIPAAQTGTPVQPVDTVKAPSSVKLDQKDMLRRLDSDPSANAARSRIQYSGQRPGTVQGSEQTVEQISSTGAEKSYGGRDSAGSFQAQRTTGSYDPRKAVGDMTTPAPKGAGEAFDMPGAVPTPDDTQFKTEQVDQSSVPALPGTKKQVDQKVAGSEVKTAQDVASESECQTCKNRKYQDGSDDPGVSFKTPTHIDPDQAASAVASHENEHVVRNQAKAQMEDRRVVSQSVTYHTAICPECGRVYVSGGTTRTVTAANNDSSQQNADAENGTSAEAVQGLPEDLGVKAEAVRATPESADVTTEAIRASTGKQADKADYTRLLPGSQSDKAQTSRLSNSQSGKDKNTQTLPGSKSDSAKTTQSASGDKSDKDKYSRYLPGSKSQSDDGNRTARTLNSLLNGQNRLQNARYLLGNRSASGQDEQQNVAYALLGGVSKL